MYVITARIFEGRNLVEYVLRGQNGNSFTADKKEVWEAAKNNTIFNVQAVGNEQDLAITGINGFELKKLPKIDYLDSIRMFNNISANEEYRRLRAANLHSRISNFSNEEFNKEMSYELTDAEYQELENKLKEREKYAFEQMFEGTHYTPKDLPKLLSGMPGNTRQEKTNNLLEFLKKDRLEKEAELQRKVAKRGRKIDTALEDFIAPVNNVKEIKLKKYEKKLRRREAFKDKLKSFGINLK